MPANDLARAAQLLRTGGLVAFPTETVYGLGADATNSAAIRRIFAAKGRPATNPLIVHVADAQTARRYTTDWPATATTLAEHFWPGPLTLILPKSPDIAPEVTANRNTVGLRVPQHDLALELLRAADLPIAAPSANRSTHVSPTTAQHVRDELGAAVDLILDGGPCTVGIESTVLDLTTAVPTILRPGHITAQMLQPFIGPVATFHGNTDPTSAAASPGQHAIHYAPRTPTFRFDAAQRHAIQSAFIVDKDADYSVILLGTTSFSGWLPELDDTRRGLGKIVELSADPQEYAHRIYALLRHQDSRELAAIYIELPPDHPEWAAVRDRLLRATQPMITMP